MKDNPRERFSRYFCSNSYRKIYDEYFAEEQLIPTILIGYKDYDWLKEYHKGYLNLEDKRNSKKKYGFKVILPNKHIQ